MSKKIQIVLGVLVVLVGASGVGGALYLNQQQQQQQQEARRAEVAAALAMAEEYVALSEKHEAVVAQMRRKGDDWLAQVKRNNEAHEKAQEKHAKEVERVQRHNIEERLRAQQEYYYRPTIWSEPTYPSMPTPPPVPKLRKEADQLKQMVDEVKAFRLKSDELPAAAATDKLRRLLSTCVVGLIANIEKNADAAAVVAKQTEGSDDSEEGEGGEYIGQQELLALKLRANKTYDKALTDETTGLKETYRIE